MSPFRPFWLVSVFQFSTIPFQPSLLASQHLAAPRNLQLFRLNFLS